MVVLTIVPQTVSIPRLQAVKLRHHKAKKQSNAQEGIRLTRPQCELAAYTPEVHWTSGCGTKKVSV